MNLEDFLNCVSRGKIPPEAPDFCTESGVMDFGERNFVESLSTRYASRDLCTRAGMWGLVSADMAASLAKHIGTCHVLEIMAGKGWLALALFEQGVRITATDDESWEDQHHQARPVYPVIPKDCVDAVKQYPEAEVLLVSWPPYGDTRVLEALRLWGSARPVIYIGEENGCNATPELFELVDLRRVKSLMQPSWPGIHDHIYVGFVNKERESP
jgi:hypothetical protein